MKYIMALDQGTTSSRCIIFNDCGEEVSVCQKETTQIFPEAGWVEQDACEIWQTQLEVAKGALSKAGLPGTKISAIGITNQRETTILWDKCTGKPIYHAIVWQCHRTAEECSELVHNGWKKKIHKITGLLIDAYFSATKIKWILDHVPGARDKARKGEILFGTVDTWLIWNLTGGKVHATDFTNAARTMLFDINELKWSKELLGLFDIPEAMLPTVMPTSGVFGESEENLFGSSIPIAAAVGDQQAALFGQACFSEGDTKNTYGTGGFLLLNTGEMPVYSLSGMLTTIAWGMDGKVTYALEGSVFVAGAAVQWLRDELQIITHASETEQIAESLPDNGGVYVVPAFVGLGAPYWDPYARGTIVGLTRGTGRPYIVRAVLEAIAYQTKDVLDVMKKESGLSHIEVRVDGGACANNFLAQFQSDITKSAVVRPACIETTALGASFLAGLAVGVYKDLDGIKQLWKEDRTFYPQMDDIALQKNLLGWRHAVKMTQTGSELGGKQ